MVFRKESKVDAFQRQISALRQQLGNEEAAADDPEDDAYYDEPLPEQEAAPTGFGATSYRAADAGSYAFAAPTASFQLNGYDESESTMAVAAPAVDAQTSVVAHDTTWNGELKSGGSLHVHGVVEGGLSAQQDVFIAEEAEVTATITATNVIVAGQVRGTIRCSARFEVLPSGRVFAEVQAPTLVVHEGASVNGQVRMGGEEPAKVATATASPPVVQRRAARNHA